MFDLLVAVYLSFRLSQQEFFHLFHEEKMYVQIMRKTKKLLFFSFDSSLLSKWFVYNFIYRFLHHNWSFFHLFPLEKNVYWITRKNNKLSVFSILHSFTNNIFMVSFIIIIVYLLIKLRYKIWDKQTKKTKNSIFFHFS